MHGYHKSTFSVSFSLSFATTNYLRSSRYAVAATTMVLLNWSKRENGGKEGEGQVKRKLLTFFFIFFRFSRKITQFPIYLVSLLKSLYQPLKE